MLISKRFIFVNVSLLVLLSLTIGCNNASDTDRFNVMVSRATDYSSIQGLRDNSSLVVKGTISGIDHIDQESPAGMGATYFTFSVEKALFPNEANIDGDIIVRQDGYDVGQTARVVLDSPLMKKGDNVVLFLKQPEPEDGKYYYIVGGPQGRFVVQDNKVFSLNHSISSVHESTVVEINGMTLEEFSNEMKPTKSFEYSE